MKSARTALATLVATMTCASFMTNMAEAAPAAVGAATIQVDGQSFASKVAEPANYYGYGYGGGYGRGYGGGYGRDTAATAVGMAAATAATAVGMAAATAATAVGMAADTAATAVGMAADTAATDAGH